MSQSEKNRRPAGKARLEEARAQMYRDLILEAAERRFAASGVASVTMRDIASEAGISPKTLYAAFASKDDIVHALRVTRVSVLMERVVPALEGPGPALDRLTRSTREYVDFFLKHQSFFRMQLQDARSWGITPGATDRAEAWRRGLKLQADLIRDGIAEGVFFEGDPELLAATAIAIIQVQLAALTESNPDPSPGDLVDALMLQLRRSFCRPEALETPASEREAS